MPPPAADEGFPPLPRLHPVVTASAAGALWGVAGYAVLWGLTPIVVSRRFVVSGLGTLALFPVRVVLRSLRALESWTGRAFHFADNNWWIGLAAALVGAAILAGGAGLVLLAVRRFRS